MYAELRPGADGNEVQTLKWPNMPLELQFEEDTFPFEGSFIDFPASVDGQNLLGRRDFFQRYIIQFWDAQSPMNIDVSPDFPHQPDGSP